MPRFFPAPRRPSATLMLAWCLACAAGAASAGCSDTVGPSDLAGTWGGAHVEVSFDSTGAATIQYDCAHGRIAPPVTLTDGGTLAASGVHVREHGGPVRDGEPEDAHPAEYTGRLDGDQLTFSVTLRDDGSVLGPFAARRGRPAQLFRCL